MNIVDLPWIAIAVVAVLLFGAASFLIYFLAPARRLNRALTKAVTRLEASKVTGEWVLICVEK